jgi:hypothetical protein
MYFVDWNTPQLLLCVVVWFKTNVISSKISEELECAFGVVGKILMSRISWNLFGKVWIHNVGDIEFLSDFFRWKFQ